MIYFPRDLTPVPSYPGYFWDTKEHKLYSIKVGGVLRELKMRRVGPWMTSYSRFSKYRHGEKFYGLSREGRQQVMLVRDLKKLELVDYDMPVVNRIEAVTA